MSRIASVPVFLFAFACVLNSAQADQPITLRYKMNRSDKLIYQTTSTTKITQSVNDMKFKTSMKQTEITLRTLEDVDKKGNFRLKSENKRLQIKMKVEPVGEYSFDSTSDERDSGSMLSSGLNPIYERLSGAFLTVTHSPRGDVKEVKGFKELLADVVKDNPFGAQFAGGGSDEFAKLSKSDMFVVLSEKAVKPGDKWESAYELAMPKFGTVKGKRIYTYLGPDKVGGRKTAKISVEQELSFKLDLNMDNAKVSGEFKTDKSSGTVQFDPLKGQLVSKKTQFTLSGTLTVDANGNIATIESEQTQEVAVELLDKLPK